MSLGEHIENPAPTILFKALDTSFKLDWLSEEKTFGEFMLKIVDLSEYLIRITTEKNLQMKTSKKFLLN